MHFAFQAEIIGLDLPHVCAHSCSSYREGKVTFEVIAYTHMAAPPDTHLKWTCLLRDVHFPGSRERYEQVAEFLVKNDLFELDHLESVDHPAEWLGAEELTQEELAELWKVCKYEH